MWFLVLIASSAPWTRDYPCACADRSFGGEMAWIRIQAATCFCFSSNWIISNSVHCHFWTLFPSLALAFPFFFSLRCDQIPIHANLKHLFYLPWWICDIALQRRGALLCPNLSVLLVSLPFHICFVISVTLLVKLWFVSNVFGVNDYARKLFRHLPYVVEAGAFVFYLFEKKQQTNAKSWFAEEL